MKKLITILLLLAMILLPVISLSEVDVSSMTDQELTDLIAACSSELMARNKVDPDGILIFEHEGVRVYQTGEAYTSANGYLYIPVAVYNGTDHEMVISAEGVLCNGWDIFGGNCRASGNAKKKNDLAFKISDACLTSIDEIISLTYRWQVYDFDARKTVYTQEEPEEHRFW